MKKTPWQNEHGAAVVEFALIATLFLTIVFGIIEFGFLLYDKHVLTNASREGARAGIVMRAQRISDSYIQNDVIRKYAEEHMVGFGTSNTLDFGPWPGEDPSTWISPDQNSRVGPLFGTELRVTVKYPFNFLLLSNLGLGPIMLKAETRMRME